LLFSPCFSDYLAAAAFDADGLDIYQTIGDLLLGGGQYPRECRPGDIHQLCCVNLLQFLKAAQAHRLKFIQGQIYPSRLIQRFAQGLKAPLAGCAFYQSCLLGPQSNLLVMNVCS